MTRRDTATRFGPKNRNEREIFAIENLRADLQYTLHNVMREKKVSRKELAKRLNCSQANVTQLLGDDANPTVETIARIFLALQDEILLTSKHLEEQKKREQWQDRARLFGYMPIVLGKTQLEWEHERTDLPAKQSAARQTPSGKSVSWVMQALEDSYSHPKRANQSNDGDKGRLARTVGVVEAA